VSPSFVFNKLDHFLRGTHCRVERSANLVRPVPNGLNRASGAPFAAPSSPTNPVPSKNNVEGSGVETIVASVMSFRPSSRLSVSRDPHDFQKCETSETERTEFESIELVRDRARWLTGDAWDLSANSVEVFEYGRLSARTGTATDYTVPSNNSPSPSFMWFRAAGFMVILLGETARSLVDDKMKAVWDDTAATRKRPFRSRDVYQDS
jgi:hypothetical protein